MTRTFSLHFLFAGLALTFVATAQSVPTPRDLPAGAPAGMVHIDRKELLDHASKLASDEFEGRLTGSPGQVKAAEYIAAHFGSLGLEPLGDVGPDGKRSFFQNYPLIRTTLDAEKSRIAIAATPKVTIDTGYAVVTNSRKETHEIRGKLTFAGLGRFGGEHVDIVDGQSLENVVPLVLVRLPDVKSAGVEMKFGIAFSLLNSLKRSADRMERAGAQAVLFGIVEDDGGLLLDVLNYIAMSPGKDILAPAPELQKITGPSQFSMFTRMIAGRTPRVFLGPKATASALEALGVSVDSAKELLRTRDAAPESKPVAVEVDLAVDVEPIQARNVAAVRRGSDPDLAQEAIVYSAHMDHIGLRLDGETFNGGDDNASGSAGLLDIAQAFAKEDAPKRSVIFLSVSGEELGLWGSAWFAARPTWPLESLVANINIDMIGRSGINDGTTKDATDDDGVLITPSFAHGKFSSIVRDGAKFATAMQMTLASGDEYYTRSDHYNFAKKDIPVVFFFAGDHPDYHQVTDHADKLDPVKMERVARLAYWTGYAVANDAARPSVLGRSRDWEGARLDAGGEKQRGGK